MSLPAVPRAWPIRPPAAAQVRVALEMTTLVLLVAFAWQLRAAWNSEWARLFAGGDLGGYLEGVRNSELRFDYSLLNLPLVVLPAIAWMGRTRLRAQAPRPAG